MNHVDLVRSSYEAFSQGDLPSLLATFDDEIEWRPAEGHPYASEQRAWIGPEAISESLFMRTAEEWDEFSARPSTFHDAGETIIVEGRYGGVHKGTGRRLDAQFCHLWTIRAGKIRVFQQYLDTAQLRRVMDTVGICPTYPQRLRSE